MKETFLIEYLSEPHYVISAWRQYDSKYLLFPETGAIFSVRHWNSEQDRSKYIDNIIDTYTAIYEAQNLTFDTTTMAIGLGKRGDIYTLATWLSGGNLTHDKMQGYANKAADHHAKAVFMNKI